MPHREFHANFQSFYEQIHNHQFLSRIFYIQSLQLIFISGDSKKEFLFNLKYNFKGLKLIQIDHRRFSAKLVNIENQHSLKKNTCQKYIFAKDSSFSILN